MKEQEERYKEYQRAWVGQQQQVERAMEKSDPGHGGYRDDESTIVSVGGGYTQGWGKGNGSIIGSIKGSVKAKGKPKGRGPSLTLSIGSLGSVPSVSDDPFWAPLGTPTRVTTPTAAVASRDSNACQRMKERGQQLASASASASTPASTPAPPGRTEERLVDPFADPDPFPYPSTGEVVQPGLFGLRVEGGEERSRLSAGSIETSRVNVGFAV
jgi:hypothetical protein